MYLDRELGLDVPAGDERSANIVVLRADDRQFGLVVEGIEDTQEIVVKPLGKLLKGIGVFAGATIMGDGRVGLILDVMGLAQRAHVVSEGRERALADVAVEDVRGDHERPTLLVFESTAGDRVAVALDAVDRLEEFSAESVERSGDALVVQYPDAILPLVDLSEALNAGRRRRRSDITFPDVGAVEVIVHRTDGGSIGLLVDRILDVTEMGPRLDPAGRGGVLGTTVIQGRVTEVIDPGFLRDLAARRRREVLVGA